MQLAISMLFLNARTTMVDIWWLSLVGNMQLGLLRLLLLTPPTPLPVLLW